MICQQALVLGVTEERDTNESLHRFANYGCEGNGSLVPRVSARAFLMDWSNPGLSEVEELREPFPSPMRADTTGSQDVLTREQLA